MKTLTHIGPVPVEECLMLLPAVAAVLAPRFMALLEKRSNERDGNDG